jgi:hypothetical protein
MLGAKIHGVKPLHQVVRPLPRQRHDAWSWRQCHWRQDVISWRQLLWRQDQGLFFEFFRRGACLKESFQKRVKKKQKRLTDGPLGPHG